jgi:uncharacterized protein YidB (DUF937 family)
LPHIFEEIEMGLLDQILGGLTGGPDQRAPQSRGGMGSSVLMALLPVVIGMLSRRGGGMGGMPGLGAPGSGSGGMGGLGGLGGLGANSWVGTGSNEALSPEAVGDVFGGDQISQIAQQAGVSTEDAQNGLAELLPNLVDHFTPNGEVPAFEQMTSSVDDFMRRLQG